MEYKSFLTFEEMTEYINYVVDQCFDKDDEGNDVDYFANCKIPAIQSAFCDHYLGFKTGENFEEDFKYYMGIDMFNEELYRINRIQFNAILSAINEQIEFRKQQMLNNKKSAMDLLLNELTAIVHKFGETFNSSDVATLLPQLAKLGEKGLDEKTLVDLIVNNKKPRKPRAKA